MQLLSFASRSVASIDSLTHIATSRETSMIKGGFQSLAPTTELFQNYPRWLARRSVTFSLFQCRSEGTMHQIVMMGIVVLAFGAALVSTTATETKVIFPVVGGKLSGSGEGVENGALVFEASRGGSIVTRISNYEPAIAGRPHGMLAGTRRIIYRLTQMLAHSYVMWRFHSYVAILANAS